MNDQLKLGSLFDGIAGFPLSAEAAGIKSVWASEIEPFPATISKRHFPDMTHLGDITKVKGNEIEPVDIITFGSPCQDLSVAGKQKGLAGERSGLFMEAIRIIKEMRDATNGSYPRIAFWENVPGAFGSSNRQDFRAVLEEIMESEVPMPKSGRWATAGMVRGNGRSLAWRVPNAQHWGVPQRRRRIFLVADFGGQCAPEILFEPEGLPWNSKESGEAREEVAATVGAGVEESSRINCTRRGIAGTVSSKWAKGTGGPAGDEHYNLIVENSKVFYESGPGWIGEGFGCLRAEGENRPSRPTHTIVEPIHKNFKDMVCEDLLPYCPTEPYKDLCLCEGNCCQKAYENYLHELMEPIMLENHPHDSRVKIDKSGTSQTLTKQMGTGGGNVPLLMEPVTTIDYRNLAENEQISGTLQAKASGGYSLNYINPVRIKHVVRRLTPKECERLQGLPDNYTEGGSDSARYRAIGNGIAIPPVKWTMQQIARRLT